MTKQPLPVGFPQQRESAEYQRQTSFVYGDQTQGRVYKDLVTEFVSRDQTSEDNALRDIRETLRILGIDDEKMRHSTVLDIGTGRHTLRFHALGAKEIVHFDISPQHVANTRRYCRERDITNITSIEGDLTRDPLPEQKFDLVYSAGIFQHIQVPALGLINFAQSLAVGGCLYMGFYRSGEWRWFISALIRAGAEPSDFAPLKNGMAITFGLGDLEHFQVSRMLDDFFVPSQNCFHPDDILADLETCGLEPVYIDPDRREYNHEGGDYFTVGADRVYARKTRHYSYEQLLTKQFMTVEGRDQLRGVDYQEPLARENIQLWLELVNLRRHGFIAPEAWQHVLLNLYRFARPWEATRDAYYVQSRDEGRHKTLNSFLRNLLTTFRR